MNGDHTQSQSYPGPPSRPAGSYGSSPDNETPANFYYPPPPMMSQQQAALSQQQAQAALGGMQDPQQQQQQQPPPPLSLQGMPPHTAGAVGQQSSLSQVATVSQLYQFGGRSHMHSAVSSPALARALSTLSQDKSRRPRSEKKPIPDEQKDDKYFERRRRNNEAAKKSRDARKSREDELAIRASYLEKDNSVLKVQVASMREDAMKLRQMWFQKCQSGRLNSNRPGMGPTPQGGRNS